MPFLKQEKGPFMENHKVKPPSKTLICFGIAVVSLFFLLAWPPGAGAQESGSSENKLKDNSTEDIFKSLEKSSNGFFEEMEAIWAQMEAEEEEKWKRLDQDVLQKWDTYVHTSKKIWVDYSGERDAVSQVNFETGKVVVEAVVPKSAPDPVKEGKQIIAKQVEEMVQKPAPDKTPIMQDMLPQETVNAVTEAKIEPVVDPKPIIGKDGIERVRVRVELTMVPDHMKRRADRYVQTVEEEAQKRGVEPALVMAVMHTESAFNPMARSPAPAFGLMQLMPRFAAKEAYMQLYGAAKLLTPDYLYIPENNIELGVTYLSRLEQFYFKEVQDPVKRRYLAICAYNWGPTAMRNKFMNHVKIHGMKPKDLYQMLLKRVPNETKDYLKRVEERMLLYGG